MYSFGMSDTRNKRNLLNLNGFSAFPPVANYSTDAQQMKIDMKTTYDKSLLINKLYSIPDPLKKNLADSFITGEVEKKTSMAPKTENFVCDNKIEKENIANHGSEFTPPWTGIAKFLSGVFNFMSASMFQKRENSTSQYYDCFEQEDYDDMAPSLHTWQSAKLEVQNKNGRAQKVFISTNEPTNIDCFNVNADCNETAAHCENSISQVCLFPTNNQTSNSKSDLINKQHQKSHMEANSIQDKIYKNDDLFAVNEYLNFPGDTYMDDFPPFSCRNPELLISDAPKVNTEYLSFMENMEITKIIPDIESKCSNVNPNKDSSNINDIIASCEDKINKLKALRGKYKSKLNTEAESVQNKQQNLLVNERQSKPLLIPSFVSSETTNNSKSGNSKECDESMKSNFPNNKLFNEEIVNNINNYDLSIESLTSSVEDEHGSDTLPEFIEPSNYFDEVTGRFYSSSVPDSEDSFQIVFTDNPKMCRNRRSSDCESEDSFIVFEESPSSCYISDDVFGVELDSHDIISNDSDSDSSEVSDDSDLENDYDYNSDCDSFHPTCKLSHSLSRTISDLTDSSLYEDNVDEIDCAVRFSNEEPAENILDETQQTKVVAKADVKPQGLLIDEVRKMEKRKQPRKSVHFNPHPPKVHVMRVWAFAARQARAGHWERHALDRERFKRRIADVDMAVSWVLKPQHRARVMFQRFMPWWNAQKRKELADKKKQEEEGKNNGEIKDLLSLNTLVTNDILTDHQDDAGVVENNDDHEINNLSTEEIEICNNEKGEKQTNSVMNDTNDNIGNNNKSIIAIKEENLKNILNETQRECRDSKFLSVNGIRNNLTFGGRNNNKDLVTT